MSLYTVKNDEGDYLDGFGFTGMFGPHANVTNIYQVAQNAASREGGYVVELVEKFKPVEVNEDEGDLLRKAKQAANPMQYIYANSESGDEYSLMHAYVIGWTVVKPRPKQYILPVDGTQDGEGNYRYAYVDDDGSWAVSDSHLVGMDKPAQVWRLSESDLDNAPGWVKTLVPLEV